MSSENPIKRNNWKSRFEEWYDQYYAMFWCGIVCLFGAFIVLYAFLKDNGWGFSLQVNQEQWGQYGDVIGGVLGTIIAYVSVIYLVQTLREQKKSNTETTANNNKILHYNYVQLFDENFQYLMNLYREASLNKQVMEDGSIVKDPSYIKHMRDCSYDSQTSYAKRVNAACVIYDRAFYIPNRVQTAVHFRALYRVFELIVDSGLNEQKYMTKYAKLVRSQINEEELLLLRYNCLCQYGQKMQKHVNRFNLLKHLPISSLLEFSYWRDEVLKDTMLQNVIDTEMICQRKWISEEFSRSAKTGHVNSVSITNRYSLHIAISDNKKRFSYSLVRHNFQPSTKVIDEAFDKFGTIHLGNFICDFLKELFEYSNFNVYNKLAGIRYEILPEVIADDDSTSTYEVVLTAVTPMCLKYMDYKNGVAEDLPEPMKSRSYVFLAWSKKLFNIITVPLKSGIVL